MGKLSVLGAQRVKALESMLDDKMQAEINALPTVKRQDADVKVREEFGLQEKYEQAQELIRQANETLTSINAITGDKDYAALSTNSQSHMNRTPFAKRVEAVMNERKEKVAEIKAAYNRKKQMLWLCETLEDAKRIVGLEEEDGDTKDD